MEKFSYEIYKQSFVMELHVGRSSHQGKARVKTLSYWIHKSGLNLLIAMTSTKRNKFNVVCLLIISNYFKLGEQRILEWTILFNNFIKLHSCKSTIIMLQ